MGKYILNKTVKWAVLLIASLLVIYFILSLAPGDPSQIILEKPVILLYPQRETELTVRLDIDGEMTVSYPEYRDGWQVTACPGGGLKTGGQYHNCLFWEAESRFEPDLSTGFVVKGEDTADFLEEKLAEIGLSWDEANDFIVHWLPRMKDNAYNLISFQGENYRQAFPLSIEPAPDSILRVFMAFKPLSKPVEIEEQVIEPFERVGFTAVEWGGCEIK